MGHEVAYLLREIGGTRRTSWGVIVVNGAVISYSTGAFIEKVKELKRDGYEIVQEGVPVDQILRNYDRTRFRELNPEERGRLRGFLESA